MSLNIPFDDPLLILHEHDNGVVYLNLSYKPYFVYSS